MEAVSLFAPGWIRSGRDPGSPGLSGLLGSLSTLQIQRASLPSNLPLGLNLPHPLRNGLARPSGPFQKVARLLPLRDAGLSGLPAIRLSRPLRKRNPPRTIFSSRRPSTPYKADAPPLCGRSVLSFRESVSRFGSLFASHDPDRTHPASSQS